MILKTDNNGFVINEGRKKRIQPKFKKLIQEVEQACVNHFGKYFMSFYVRGSVSVGRAVSGYSDIDFVLVLARTANRNDERWSIALVRKLERIHSEITSIDLTITSLDKLLYSQEYKNLRVFLKTQSVLLHGKDVLKYLSPIKPGRDLALQMYGDVDKELNELMNIFRTGRTKSYLGRRRSMRFWCIWTCRVILRSSLALVMVKEPVYTLDLKDCKKIFERKYPRFKIYMEKIIKWAINPEENKNIFSDFLIDFIPKYVTLWAKVKGEKDEYEK